MVIATHRYRSIHGSVTVRAGEASFPFEFNVRLHNVADDGSCGLYCLYASVLDASCSPTFWDRLLALETERPRLVRGMRTLLQLARSDTAGCPELRWALCDYMLGGGTVPLKGLWANPPAAQVLDTGKGLAEARGHLLQPSAGLWEQHAVALLDPNTFFDDHYQQVFNAWLDNGLAFVTARYELLRYNCEPVQKCTATRSAVPSKVPTGRVYVHYRNLEQTAHAGAVIIFPMCVTQPEEEEYSHRNHFQHLRAYQGEEQTALAFVDDWRRAPAATATAGSDDDGGGGGGGGASLSGGDCCIASRKRPRSGSAVAQPTPKRLSPTAAISADEPIQKDDLLLLYRHAAVCRADLKRGQGSCGGRPSEFWKTFPSDLKAKFQAHVKRAEQRIEQAGNREQAAGGPAPDVLVEAVVHKGQEIAAGETLSTVMWDMDKARYVSLCRLLSGGNLIGAPQLGLLMELIQLDLRLKHGDTVQWEDAYDSADGGGDSQAPGAGAPPHPANAAAAPSVGGDHGDGGAAGSESQQPPPGTPPATSPGYVALPLHRVVVLEEEPFGDFETLIKQVEFRHGKITSVRPGMWLLFALSLALRRVGRTCLLLAEVADVLHCSVEEAYRRFPNDAHRCNLWMRCAGRTSRTVTCIVVQNVRPAPEFSFLVPGNLGFLHQFSLKRGTPQFCLTSDLNKTVSVVLRSRSGQTVQRRLIISAAHAHESMRHPEDDTVAHVDRMASLRGRGNGSDITAGPGQRGEVISLLDSPPNPGADGIVDLTAGNLGRVYRASWHPFAAYLDGSPIQPGSFRTMHEFVETSLNTLFPLSVAHNNRKAVCNAMLDLLGSDSDELPASPHMLSHDKLETLRFRQNMSGDYVDLFLLLFSDACRMKSHKMLNNWHDVVFAKPTTCPFSLGEWAGNIVLNGIHLFEQIDHEREFTPKFEKDCGDCLRNSGVVMGVRGRNTHYQAFTLDVRGTEGPVMKARCSMGWNIDADTQTNLNKVVRGVLNDSGATVAIEEIIVPPQLTNECGARALGDVFELALRKSYGFEGLERDRGYIQARGAEKRKVTTETNTQGERLRMFMQLSMLKIMSTIDGDSQLFPNFEQALERGKGFLTRSKTSRAQRLEAGSSPAAGSSPGGGRFRRQVLLRVSYPLPSNLTPQQTHSPLPNSDEESRSPLCLTTPDAVILLQPFSGVRQVHLTDHDAASTASSTQR